MCRAGIIKRKKETDNYNNNLLFEYGQLGMNSSFEEENEEEISAVREVQIADMDENNVLNANNIERDEDLVLDEEQ